MISGLALGALVVSGCKPSGSATTKSLDNFAAGKNLHWNDCRAPSESARAERLPFAKAINIDVVGKNANGNKAKLVSAVQDSLTAVPREYLAMFYAAGGSFVISDETPQLCTDLFKSTNPQSPDVESCHIFMAKAGKPSVSILMKADERTIRHETVKAVGLAYADTFSRFQGKGSQISLSASKGDVQTAAERIIANSFLYDLYLINNVQMWTLFASTYFDVEDPSALAKYFKETKVSEQVKSSNDIISKLSFKSDVVKQQFFGLAFAHTFDSAYCNRTAKFDPQKALEAVKTDKLTPSQRSDALKNTYQVMQQIFPVTSKTFSMIEPQLYGQAYLIFQVSGGGLPTISSPAEKSSFQLADESDQAFRDSADLWGSVPPFLREAVAGGNVETAPQKVARYNAGRQMILNWYGLEGAQRPTRGQRPPSNGSGEWEDNDLNNAMQSPEMKRKVDAATRVGQMVQLGQVPVQMAPTLFGYMMGDHGAIQQSRDYASVRTDREYDRTTDTLSAGLNAGGKIGQKGPVPYSEASVGGNLDASRKHSYGSSSEVRTPGAYVPFESLNNDGILRSFANSATYASIRDQPVRDRNGRETGANYGRLNPVFDPVTQPVAVGGGQPVRIAQAPTSSQWGPSTLPNQSPSQQSRPASQPASTTTRPASTPSSNAPPLIPIR